MLVESRFTIDGSSQLEAHLDNTCRKVLDEVRRVIPNGKLEGLLLGGGYGRGQGGVLKNNGRDLPYNDLEFYVILAGNEILNRQKYRSAFESIGTRLTPEAGLHVEFHLTSRQKLQKSPVTMHYHDLVAGNKLIYGSSDLLDGLDHHLVATEIPLEEGTRLLMNRCSGLLFAENLLRKTNFSEAEADFVGRNHAKAKLAFGDVVLTTHGLYHSSAIERHDRLRTISSTTAPFFEQVLKLHAQGVDFKLHPDSKKGSAHEFLPAQRELKTIGKDLWLWLENLRLKTKFNSPEEYSYSSVNKCPKNNRFRNFAVNLKAFGVKGLYGGNGFKYPRERLFTSFPLLLWSDEPLQHNKFFAKQLLTNAIDFPGLVRAYEKIWERFN